MSWYNGETKCFQCGKENCKLVKIKVLDNYFCYKHFTQWRNYGMFFDTIQRTKRDKNEIRIFEDFAHIVLYDINSIEKDVCIIDIEDLEKVSDYKWVYSFDKNRRIIYVTAKINKKSCPIHRLIMNAKKGDLVDHINGDGRDNRKINLRICSNSENLRNSPPSKNNTSGVSGVSYTKNVGKWHSVISFEKVKYNLGYFENFEDAVRARLMNEKILYGEFSPNKQLFEKYSI